MMLYCLLWLSYGLFASYYGISTKLADTHWNFIQSMPMFGAFVLIGLLFRMRFGPAKSALGLPRMAPEAS